MPDTSQLLADLSSKSENHFISQGQKNSLDLFWQMAIRVPAYKDFLKKNQIKPESIKTFTDFQKVPTIDKDNYLRSYPREATCWDGKFGSHKWVISTTSGSSGEPFYFPRQEEQDWQYAVAA